MNKELKGEIAIFIACLCFAIMAVMVKYIAPVYDAVLISAVRYVIGLIIGFMLLKALKIKFKVNDKKNWALRGVFGVMATVLFYLAIQKSSSGRATLLTNTYPVFVAFYGAVFFKEKIGLNTILSLVACMAGIVLIFYDGSSYSVKGDALALLTGMVSAIAVLYVKKARENNNPIIVYLSCCIAGLTLVPFSVHKVPHSNLLFLFILLVVGTAGFFAQVAMSYGYKYVEATKGSIISYSAIPLSIILSWFIGEEFKPRFFAGIVLIFIGLLVNRKKY